MNMRNMNHGVVKFGGKDGYVISRDGYVIKFDPITEKKFQTNIRLQNQQLVL